MTVENETGNGKSRRVTSVDVAREVGLSRTTVGFVMNDTPHQKIPLRPPQGHRGREQAWLRAIDHHRPRPRRHRPPRRRIRSETPRRAYNPQQARIRPDDRC